MHVIFRESHGLEETAAPGDLGQTPAELIVLSFSDSDLGAFAAGWRAGRDDLPSLRLANLAALQHPLSVDHYAETVLAHARCILIRLIGGESYWSYGLTQVNALAQSRGIGLAVLPADGRDDPRLDALSTLPASTLHRLGMLCDAGGAVAARAALAQMALAAGIYAGPVPGLKSMPEFGWYAPGCGVLAAPLLFTQRPRAAVTFYRAYLAAADTGAVDAMIAALDARGFDATGLFVPSLKAPAAAAWVRASLAALAPAVIVNATAFSARGDDGASPLDGAGCPVFQVALATSRRQDWESAQRGLSPADLAMHVVMPEVDGRIFAGAVSFKAQAPRDPDLQFARAMHHADTGLVAAAADRVALWHRLAATPAPERRIGLILSTYPGRPDQMAHAVGLDALASAEALLSALAMADYRVADDGAPLAGALQSRSLSWPLTDYRRALDGLPATLLEALDDAWGPPEADAQVHGGAFHFAAVQRGAALVALQPERGDPASRDADYHDLARTPRHGYVAFYLWLRAQGLHALVHMGAHGTLEWLPGKSVALSQDCWPQALTGPMPVIYPFIVNDPGEAAQAKRRIGAVTLGHLPPAQRASAMPDNLSQLERLLDEYSTADGLDPARRNRLIGLIRAQARQAGVEADLGLSGDASAAEAITRIDRFVCDLKESQFGDGLHIYGAGAGEMEGLLAALAGQRIAAGPAGSPFRGRSDVLPTGRNLYSVDPRAVPSRAAHAQGVKLAEELLRRHLQDHGDWPYGLVVDLWGSATMRTAGEEFAMALHLAGLAPRWDGQSERVNGFEVVPLALLGRPRIDVTLRLSGLFRDIFPGLGQMFEAGAAALAGREEAAGDNPYAGDGAHVFAPEPGRYGPDMGPFLERYGAEDRAAAGEAWLSASEWALTASGTSRRDRATLEARLRKADAYAHVQDLPETDLLLAADYASHEGGFAAAMAALGAPAPALYHVDSSRAETPRARTVREEIARVVRARAADPAWATGMMRHAFRGAAEIAATLDNLAAFAHLTRDVPGHLFDLYFDATLGRPEVSAFMERDNPAALAALRERFAALQSAGLWATRRNSVLAELGAQA